VAKPSDKDLEYVKRAEAMQWVDLAGLWEAIKVEKTPDWEGGKALEHLVVRAFQLDGLTVEYPTMYRLEGRPLSRSTG
jgi:hypothetical protein